MKVMDELAENYIDPFSSDFDTVPYSEEVINLLKDAYLTGFIVARKMAAQIEYEASGPSETFYRLLGLGEEEGQK